jgi:hypothetical protein
LIDLPFAFMTPDRLDELFPEIERFRELRRELDPSGAFLNPSTPICASSSPESSYGKTV